MGVMLCPNLDNQNCGDPSTSYFVYFKCIHRSWVTYLPNRGSCWPEREPSIVIPEGRIFPWCCVCLWVVAAFPLVLQFGGRILRGRAPS
jgi:hypothetical protein